PSDTAPALLSFGARVVARGPNGTRTIDMEKFHVPPGEDPQRETVLEPGEVVTEILLPPPQENTRSSYRKVRARRSWDFALAGVALALNFNGERVQDGRVAFSGVAPVPWRSREVENAIKGRRLDEKTITQAADAAVDTARPLSGNAYKIPLLKGVVYEELWKMGAGA
ncbi:MAG: FAD binding domain-containing protein, partial [Desulfovibrionales bacterium]